MASSSVLWPFPVDLSSTNPHLTVILLLCSPKTASFSTDLILTDWESCCWNHRVVLDPFLGRGLCGQLRATREEPRIVTSQGGNQSLHGGRVRRLTQSDESKLRGAGKIPGGRWQSRLVTWSCQAPMSASDVPFPCSLRPPAGTRAES